ncbi:MAG: thiol reductant ABC exporter subunit CydC [Acidocella sp. 20-57-95]|nr:MAG: thiol reductant ABC exporter subunit CydC [Acidocella sp. 20-57-95]HQT63840.1 thiol reductant ABC exporter subunit CydC [Acidocella sp.]HQU04689.1 thiol reductant ABC exporter subunit CydC [Acidocella sp.]
MRVILRLLALFGRDGGWMTGGIVLACLTILANFGLMTLSGWFLASAAIAGLAGVAAQNAFNFFSPAAGVRFFATIRVLSRYTERLVTHEATFRLLATLRVWFYTKLAPLAPAALQGYRAGDLLSRIVADIDTLNLFYLRVYVPFIAAAVAALAMVGFFGLFSLPAAVALAVGLGVTGLAVPMVTQWRGNAAGADITNLNAQMRVEMVDAIQGMGELLTYNAAPALQARVENLNKRLISRQAEMSAITGAGMAASGLFGNLTMLAVVIAAAVKVTAGQLGAADLPMLALGSMAAFEAVAPLPSALQYLGQIRAAASRIFELTDQQPAIRPIPGSAPQLSHFDLDLRGIKLRYEDNAAWALDGLDLHIPQGSHIGLQGSTGAGKSTLINLLLRFYEYQDGTASFGGVDLRAFSSEAIASYISVISQRTYLFHTTIRDNLLLAKGDASAADLWHALDVAQLADFVRAQPLGLDTIVGEAGVRLSGGQARRVAIARAVLKDTPWLILDEPTEGLDPVTERAFLRDLLAVMAGKTVLYITHRTAGLEMMDQVYALAAGKLRQPGNS